ncbi:MFS transporter [Azomonas macrocytogenes]|uniref:Putative MFS family arabinose efflux permease n=1 Tax=Azomonas macrocytogenes TaxID=69962 RepID=A0A839T277_AZOMA|nr:MFS transporter [Azomonas macrocytogenes]MBB3103069.1 putative MFS family arabinose efflux permease [Azomonas macrocytogenes]
MSLRTAIVLMSALGVLSDAILIAFYPQFFETRYGLTDPELVGAYIAAISIAVMVTLPLWARVARYVETLHLLVFTQCLAGVLCLASISAATSTTYWMLSLLMFMCKSSYLLMFPYLMRHLPAAAHGLTIGLLSVVIHLGNIFGATLGGWLLQDTGPDACLWLMAAGDFGQMLICLYLIASGRVIRDLGQTATPPAQGTARPSSALLKLSVLMLLFDFSVYLVRPFFTIYWETLTDSDQLVTGLVFAIPGLVALLALLVKQQAGRYSWQVPDRLSINLLLGLLGMLLQASPVLPLILLGRCLYGWSMFQIIVKLEVTLFRISTPADYARDFSITNFFQNLGVLLSSFIAGQLASHVPLFAIFLIAALGLLVTLLFDRGYCDVERQHAPSHPSESGELNHVH